MVPFIDVMLVLLIIFMVTAPLIAPSVIDLPSMGKANALPDKPFHVIISENEKISFKTDSGQKAIPITLKNLVGKVKNAQQSNPKVPVVINADGSVKYKVVMQVMDELKRANIERVGLAVELAK